MPVSPCLLSSPLFVMATQSIAHQIRKVIRQEAAKWAGLGTPESDARIKAMEQKINAAGGVSPRMCQIVEHNERVCQNCKQMPRRS